MFCSSLLFFKYEKMCAARNCGVLLTNPMYEGESSKGNSLSIKNIQYRGVYPVLYTIIGVEISFLSR